MKKELLEYINGERNVVQDEFIISRGKTGNGSELIFVNTPDVETPLYALWNSKRETRKRKIKVIDGGETVKIEKVAPKGTGGEPAYIMIMLKEIENLKISLEASGLLLKLFKSIEWNTGRLIRKRDKIALTKEMIAEQFGIGRVKTKKLLAELTDNKVLRYDRKTKAYYLNKNVVRKGMGM